MDRLVLEDFLPYRLNRLAADISQQLKKVYRTKHGLTVPEWRVLATVAQFSEITAKDVGAHAALHKTKVSRAVAALETKRWLRRQRDESDGRQEILSLTNAGLKAYSTMVPQMTAFESELLRRLGPERVAQVKKALSDLEAVLKAQP